MTWLFWAMMTMYPPEPSVTLTTAPSVLVILMPPERLECAHGGISSSGILASRARIDSEAAAVQLWPAQAGRVYCGGFE